MGRSLLHLRLEDTSKDERSTRTIPSVANSASPALSLLPSAPRTGVCICRLPLPPPSGLVKGALCWFTALESGVPLPGRLDDERTAVNWRNNSGVG